MMSLVTAHSDNHCRTWIQTAHFTIAHGIITSILLLLWTGSAVHAQTAQFDKVIGFGSPHEDTASMALGDFDADGTLDIVVGGDKGSLIFLNDGTGRFTIGVPLIDTKQTSSIAVGDMNGDHALDIVIDAQQNRVFVNDGRGNFSSGIAFGVQDQSSSIAVGDFNGDKTLDIVIGERFYQSPICPLCIYLNDGSGYFPNSIPIADSNDIDSLSVGDFNGDNALDIATVSTLYLNDGTGHFLNGILFNKDGGICVAVGDLNSDGALDIVVGIEDEQQNLIFFNKGKGQFADGVPLSANDSTRGIALGDINSDGALDIAVGNEQYEIAPSLFYLNDGKGHFSASIPLDAPDFTTSIALADLNLDGALDIVVGNRGQNLIFINSGAGQLLADSRTDGEKPSSNIALGDFNQDENLDLIAHNQIYWNNGDGNFTTPITLPITGFIVDAAVGDLNNDGTLDILFDQSGKISVFLNNGEGNFFAGAVFGTEDTNLHFSLLYGGKTLGDLNGDGALDIISRNTVYLNDGYGNFSNNLSLGNKDEYKAMAVGDFDNDDDLDIVGEQSSGNVSQLLVYRNEGGGNFFASSPWGATNGLTSIAVGDVNGDSALDIVAGNSNAQNLIYLNDGLGHVLATIPFGAAYTTQDVEVLDIESDGDLDITVSNRYQPNQIYINDGHGNFGATIAFGSEVIFAGDSSGDLAVGDIDRDGSQDIIVSGAYDIYLYRKGNWSRKRLADNPPYLVLERPGKTANANYYSTAESLMERVIPIHYTLFDPDGDPIRLVRAQYSLNGGVWQDAIPTAETQTTDLQVQYGYLDNTQHSLPFNWIDITNGGNGVMLGDETIQGPFPIGFDFPFYGRMFEYFWISSNGWLTFSDPAGSAYYNNECLPQTTSPINLIAPLWDDLNPEVGGKVFYQQQNNHTLVVEYFQIPSYATGELNTFEVILQQDGSITFQYLGVAQPQSGATIGLQNGTGSQGSQVICNRTFLHNNLAINFSNGRHTFYWDTFASNIFGQSKNVIFRLVAYPGIDTRPNGTVGPYQRSAVATQTFPFNVRGTQVQVFHRNNTKGNELPGAVIYRLEKEQTAGAVPMPSPRRTLYTDKQGYLQGHGELRLGDRLTALWPVTALGTLTFTHNYTLYQTSAKPTATTLDMKTVDQPGVQVLAVSEDNKLLLFNLDVALEWDARKDTQFMDRLKFDLQRTSQLLFDWSNGQAALGQVRIFQDAKRNTTITGFQPWNDSHIRIYATNRMRPSATVGGIISPTLEMYETAQGKTISYGPGQVHMGALWNRYGESSGTLGEDWPRALAHELGHYLFFLEDEYLGLNEQGVLVTIPAEGDIAHSCPGVMNDPYRESQSEFQPATGWATSGCSKTLAHQSTGRADWETISRFYPLTPSSESFGAQNPGPSTLPLAVTQLTVVSSTPRVQTLDVPIFYLTGPNGGTYAPSPHAQAYLFQGDWLTDLGQPTLDQVQAWGARPEVDRLCIYEATAGYLGCEKIRPNDDQVALQQATPWQPEIVISPVTSRTIAINVIVAMSAGKLAARLYPTDTPAPTCILLQSAGPNQYVGTFPQLTEPALDGYVHLWVQGDTPCVEPTDTSLQETVTGYAIGGNPVHRRARRTLSRGGGVHRRARRAPAVSADGQVMVFGEAFDLKPEEEWFFTLQAMSILPTIPPGRTLVGQAYRLSASANAPDLSDATISFGYLGEQVPAGEERFLRIYFWENKPAACPSSCAPCWRPLVTFKDLEYNVASAKMEGPGLYTLLSSLEVPLTAVGWNNFAYPVPGTQAVGDALAAIEGAYTVVYGFQPAAAPDPWLVYSPTAPAWVNDLKELAFGQGYWLYATEAITLYLQGGEAGQAASALGLTLPPATFYGAVAATTDFTPQEGMAVSAWIEGRLCGASQVEQQEGQLVYHIKVAADDGNTHAGCGADGRPVSFQVNGVTMAAQRGWNNTQVWNLPLSSQPGPHLYLPIIRR